ncbi:hypothetical protein [Bacillus sp. B1-b2]|uniref:hypothetical protein n=1 Tax=Bacillus sp. B1-b2 TaxID=2653201 RepID=UPI00186A3262
MYRKNCDRCKRPSFSSSEIGKWYCPICNHDLTDYPFFNAITFERINVRYPFEKVINTYQTQYYYNKSK